MGQKAWYACHNSKSDLDFSFDGDIKVQFSNISDSSVRTDSAVLAEHIYIPRRSPSLFNCLCYEAAGSQAAGRRGHIHPLEMAQSYRELKLAMNPQPPCWLDLADGCLSPVCNQISLGYRNCDEETNASTHFQCGAHLDPLLLDDFRLFHFLYAFLCEPLPRNSGVANAGTHGQSRLCCGASFLSNETLQILQELNDSLRTFR